MLKSAVVLSICYGVFKYAQTGKLVQYIYKHRQVFPMHIRSYQGTDESALLAVWNAALIADRIDARRFRTQVLLDPNFVPEQLPVAVVDGQVIGFVLALTRQVPLFLQGLEPKQAWITAFGVLPQHQRAGIGAALFAHLSQRLQADGRRTIDIAPYTPNYFVPGVDIRAYPAALDFLGTQGFDTLYHALSMGADLTGFSTPPEIQALAQRRYTEDGITITAVTAADVPDVMPFIVAHFGWDWYRHAQDTLMRLFNGDSTPLCFLVARQRGEVVGFCQQVGERFGPFGVHADLRGKGIGRLLLFECLSRMSAQAVYYSYFLWTSHKAARLYAQAGFSERREFAVLRRNL